MSVTIAPDIQAMIEAKIERRLYENPESVLREALNALDERDQLRGLRSSLMRAKDQVERGEFVEWTPRFLDDLTREADELLANGYESKSDVRP